MRLLWLTPYLPAPMSGAGTRVFNLLKNLALTSDIDLIAGASTGQQPLDALAELRSMCHTVQMVPPTVASRRHWRLLQLSSLISRHPAQYRIFHSEEMQARINSAIRGSRYDAVVLEHSFMGYYSIPRNLPMVLDQHNVESEILLRSSQRERSAVRRAYNRLEYWKYHTDERRFCRGVDLILAASARDRETMLSWGGLPSCVVIPNGVDTTYFAPVENAGIHQGAASILFTGTMNYAPNAEAMLYFAADIWPLVRGQAPGTTLQIVGNAPLPEVQRLAEIPGVTVTGSVPDVRPYLANAQVVVAPLRIGGGTRLKILEAMAMGRAIVSTSLGCEGLDVEPGRHLVVADEPAEFATRVVELLDDPEQRSTLGREGRSLAEQKYDWRALGRRMEDVLRDFLQSPRASSPYPRRPASREPT